MFKEYRTVLGQAQTEIEIKKSEFIGSMKRVNSEKEALEFIDEIKRKYRDATHNCSAYIIGETKLIQRYNDDGEPQGTAGIPMLEVLLKEDLTNVVVVVTRYFGGKKLGASGLIRAYGNVVTEVLGIIDKVWLRNFYKVKLDFEYTFLGKIDNFIGEKKYFVKSRDYFEKIENIMYIKIDQYEDFKNDIFEITSANVDIEILETLLLQTKDGEIIEWVEDIIFLLKS